MTIDGREGFWFKNSLVLKMVKDKQKTELERLRTEAESLQREEDSHAPVSPAAPATEENNSLRDLLDTSDEGDLNSQLEELVEVLEQELKDTNPITLLIVFALGILIGRLLPR